MNRTIRTVSLTAAGLMAVLVAGQALAHHSFAMFNRDSEQVMKGTVARWAFNSPHVALYIENEAGELWAFEGAAPAMLVGLGMTGYTFEPGEAVTVVMCPLRDGRKGGAVGYVVKAGAENDFETWLRPNDGGCSPSPSWREWLPAGYTSRAAAEEALGVQGRPGAGFGAPPP